MAQSKQAGRKSRRRGNEERTPAELVTLGISLALLALVVGGLVWLDVSTGDSPPQFKVDLAFDDAYERGGEWYLPVTITNVGDRSTDILAVDVTRPVEGEEPEVSTLQYAFVAGGEEVSGYAVFDERPTEATIEADVQAVTEP